jgi:predicted lipoprotein with Yx(FWY)xxD motif
MHHRRSLLVLALLASLVLAAAAAGATSREHVVNTAKNAKLGKTILVTLGGRTLYSLSAERNGKFICVDKTCLSFWKPLVVGRGVTPTGVNGLATVKRPDGRRQVSFRGGPLYTFTGDHKRGDAKGEGFKDVGVWHAASTAKTAAPPPTTTSGGGGGYHY